MQETLFAFLAVLLLAMFGLNQQRAIFFSGEESYDREIQMAATDLALDTLATIGTRYFDEYTADNPVTGPGKITPSEDLSWAIAGDDEDWGQRAGDTDDIDDFDGQAGSAEHRLNDQTFDFDLQIEVEYVKPNDPTQTSAVPTTAKRVTVEVFELDSDFEEHRRYVELDRVYSLVGRWQHRQHQR